jgi:hypothetical protein
LINETESVEVNIDRGDVEIRQARSPVAKLRVEVDSGDIELALPPSAKFSILGETARGEIANSFDEKFKVETDNHGAKLSGGSGTGPELRLKTGRGLFNLRKMSAAESASLEAPTAPKPTPKELPAPQKAENQ